MDILNSLKRLNKSQEEIAIGALQKEIGEVKKALVQLRTLLQFQLNSATPHDWRFAAMLVEEEEILHLLKQKLLQEHEYVKRLNFIVSAVKDIEYSNFFRKIANAAAKFFTYKDNAVEIVGLENIPMKGPVVIAPRHYHGQYDGPLMMTIIPRRFFVLIGVDWVQKKYEIFLHKTFYPKFGSVTINRPDAPTTSAYPNSTPSTAMRSLINMLLLDQAVLIFPEGWPVIDIHYTPRTDRNGIFSIKPGIMFVVDYAQKSKGVRIPIIPIGLNYLEGKRKGLIEVNIGKSLYLPLNSSKADYDITTRELQAEMSRLSKIE